MTKQENPQSGGSLLVQRLSHSRRERTEQDDSVVKGDEYHPVRSVGPDSLLLRANLGTGPERSSQAVSLGVCFAARCFACRILLVSTSTIITEACRTKTCRVGGARHRRDLSTVIDGPVAVRAGPVAVCTLPTR